jgi:mRNA interferase MazF
MARKRGEVVVVDFPFSDGSGAKRRPAVVVQADLLNRATTDTILASISTTATGGPTQVLIDASTDPNSGLSVACGVRCEKLAVIEQNTVYGTAGHLSRRTMQKVDTCLKFALGVD